MSENIVDILLVEDNPSDLELTLHAIQKHNLTSRVAIARDGAEALDLVFDPQGRSRSNLPRVIFLDLKLPKIDGLEVLKRLKTDRKTRHIPVVVLTSSREERDLAASYSVGVNSYIVKPVDFNQFIEAVKQLGSYWLLLNQPREA